MNILEETRGRQRAYTSVMSLMNVMAEKGFVDRTPQGRVATKLAYEHLDLPYNEQTQPKLF